jgi:transcriptional regulator with XRE-family HTH domain
MTENTFAQELREARAAAGLSQQGMADRTLISIRTLQKWEIGERVPPEYVQRFVLNELRSMTPGEE